VKQMSGVRSDPPLLLSHSAASTSCESRLEEQLTPRQLRVVDADDDDVSECSRYLLQHMHTAPSLDVAVQRVLCPYHQLVASSSANVAAEPAAFVTFHDATLRRMPDDDFYFRAGEHAVGGAGACRHEIDLIRDSLNNSATPRNSCDRQTVELAPVSAEDDGIAGQHWRTTPRSATAPSSSTLGGNLSRTLGRATDVSFTCHQRDDTAPARAPAVLADSSDQVTC